MQAVLYSFRRCPYAMRARFALLHCGIDYEHREILLKSKPASLLEASPKGTVPVLLDGHRVIEQSLDIMVWAYGLADKPKQESKALQELIAQNDGFFKTWLDRYKYADRHTEFTYEYAQTQASTFVARIESVLGANGYLATPESKSSNASFSDFAIMPFVRQFAGVDAKWFAAQPWPKTQHWLATMIASDLFQRVMHKYRLWSADSLIEG